MKFGTDGVRGRVNVDLTVADALALGQAAGHVLGGDVAVVGGDTRESTPMFEAALVAGFASLGLEVHRLGVAPTPMVAHHAGRLGAVGAVVSASHNPYHDNGIKLFGRGGVKLTDSAEREIEAVLADRSVLASTATDDRAPGRLRDGSSDATSEYVSHLLSVLDGRGLDGLRVVVDAANGAASFVAEATFARAGAAVTVVNDRPDGRNINVSCGATDPSGLTEVVRGDGADVGLALDGDADRLIAVDERGRVVDGDRIIAIAAADMRRRGALRYDAVVVTVMTNLGFRLAMADAGIRVVETPVGDRAVLQALDDGGYSLGGEQSGHVIFRDHASTGDGLLTGLVLLDIVRRSGRRLSDLADEAMERIPQVLVNVPVVVRSPDIAERIAAEIEAAGTELGDDGRVLVRPSGTEPLVRVMVEARDADAATRVADRLADAVRSQCG